MRSQRPVGTDPSVVSEVEGQGHACKTHVVAQGGAFQDRVREYTFRDLLPGGCAKTFGTAANLVSSISRSRNIKTSPTMQWRCIMRESRAPSNALPISRAPAELGQIDRKSNLQKTYDLDRPNRGVGCIPPSRWAVTPHQMTGRILTQDWVGWRPVITMGMLDGNRMICRIMRASLRAYRNQLMVTR